MMTGDTSSTSDRISWNKEGGPEVQVILLSLSDTGVKEMIKMCLLEMVVG